MLVKGSAAFLPGFYSPQWWRTVKAGEHDCTIEELEAAIQGYFTADALPSNPSRKPGISGKVGRENSLHAIYPIKYVHSYQDWS